MKRLKSKGRMDLHRVYVYAWLIDLKLHIFYFRNLPRLERATSYQHSQNINTPRYINIFQKQFSIFKINLRSENKIEKKKKNYNFRKKKILIKTNIEN